MEFLLGGVGVADDEALRKSNREDRQSPRRPAPADRWMPVRLVVAAAGVVTLTALALGGAPAGTASLFAAGVCLVGLIVGEAVGVWLVGERGNVLVRYFGGMLIRMGVPLAAVIVLCVTQGPLFEAGGVYYILGFYLVALLGETAALTRSLTPTLH